MVIKIIDPHTKFWPIWDVHFGWIFRNTTTNGGDMGAHVYLPWFLEHNWFPKLRLAGWSPDWYAGFPIGQYYFPVPSLVVALLNTVMPYNVAFKIVTVSGPVMLPAAAYVFARGMRTPFPAAPAFAIAAFGMLVQERTDWNIYGGNIASTLAGEYSFEIALAFSLFALGALAYTLDTGQRRWLPAVLIAAAVMSHIVVAIFVGVAATFIWLVRSPRRTWPLAVAVGAVGLLLTAVWTIPLLGQQAYTQSMRYAKVFSTGSSFKLPYWVFLPNPVKHTIEGIVRGVSPRRDLGPARSSRRRCGCRGGSGSSPASRSSPPGWYRRRSTLVLLLIAACFGVFFVQWPEHAVWNTRFLPFWLLTWGFLAAHGRGRHRAARGEGHHVGVHVDQRGRPRRRRAPARGPTSRSTTAPSVDPSCATARSRCSPTGSSTPGPPGLDAAVASRARACSRAARARSGRSRSRCSSASRASSACGSRGARATAIRASASRAGPQYNYDGYQSLGPSWPEFHSMIDTMNKLPPGRAVWEGGDAVGAYGTTLVARAAAVLHQGPHRLDGRPVLRVVGDGARSTS